MAVKQINDYACITSSLFENNRRALPDNLLLAINDSIWDTIYRGLDQKIELHRFYQSDNDFKLNTFRYKKEEFFHLLNVYVKIIDSVKPSHTFLSHGNYTPYLALIAACYIRDIPFTIIHGGHQAIFSALPGRYPKTFSPLAAVRDIVLNYLPDPFLTRPSEKRQVSMRDSSNSFINFVNNLPGLDSVAQENEIKYLMLIMPVLKEVNNHYSSELEIYNSRYDWLKDTLFCALDVKLYIIIKRHPHEAPDEKNLVDQLLQQFSTEHPNFNLYVRTAYSVEDLGSIIPPNISRHEIAFYIYQSMSSCELPQVGIIPFSANQCFAHSSFYHSFSSKSDYLASIKGLKKKRKAHVVSNDTKNLAHSYIKTCNILRGNSNPHGGFRKALDQYYHFGNIRNSSINSIVMLKKNIIENLTYKLFHGDLYTVVKEEYRDINESYKFSNSLLP